MSQPFSYQEWLKSGPGPRVKYTHGERKGMAADIMDAMREAYEEEGIEGDFDDGARYLRDDASDEELDAEYTKWVKHE